MTLKPLFRTRVEARCPLHLTWSRGDMKSPSLRTQTRARMLGLAYNDRCQYRARVEAQSIFRRPGGENRTFFRIEGEKSRLHRKRAQEIGGTLSQFLKQFLRDASSMSQGGDSNETIQDTGCISPTIAAFRRIRLMTSSLLRRKAVGTLVWHAETKTANGGSTLLRGPNERSVQCCSFVVTSASGRPTRCLVATKASSTRKSVVFVISAHQHLKHPNWSETPMQECESTSQNKTSYIRVVQNRCRHMRIHTEASDQVKRSQNSLRKA